MPELDLIRRIAASAPNNQPALIQGIGDDCAILRPNAKHDLVFTTDFVIEGRHFTCATHKASDIGHKALARSLSDLAAMGGEPVFCLVSLALPIDKTTRWIDGFYRGLLGLARKYKITLAGGDLSTDDKVIADVMCCGRVPRGQALLRSGAKPGDGIYVTGRLGRPWEKHLRPKPRIEAGMALRRIATAAMDISDGLALDLHRLCLQSKATADIDSVAIPVFKGSTLDQALYGGEDYELLFTTRKTPPIEATRIGEITRGKPGQMNLDGRTLKPKGWDPFR